MKATRRELIEGLLAAGLLAGCAREWEPLPGRGPDPSSAWEGRGAPDTDAFPLGAMLGDPLPDAVIAWTRYAGAVTLRVLWATWDGAWVEAGEAKATVADGGFVHVDLRELPPDTPVAVQFEDASGARSVVAHGRTAPSAEVAGVVRILALNCANQDHGDFPVIVHGVGRGAVDLVAWLGDTTYADGATTRADYREKWRENYVTPSFQRVLPFAAHTFTWDDHEVANNWDPELVDPDQLAAATGAFFEHTPTRPDAPGRIWRRLRFGRTVDVFVLDSRGERRPSEGRYLSEAQIAWLLDGLTGSDATWKLVFSSVPITDFPGVFDVPEALADRWEGFPADRARVLDAVAGLTGVLFLAGDIHMPAMARVDPEGPHLRTFEIVVGSAGSRPNPIGYTLGEQFPGQFPWASGTRSATRLELDPNGYGRVWFWDEADTTLYEALFDHTGHLLWQAAVPSPA